MLWLVVPGGVEGEVAEQFAGGRGDYPDVEVLDEQQDVGSGVGSSDADVVQAAVVAQGDDAGVVDAVAADPLMRRRDAGGGGFGAGGVGGGRGRGPGPAQGAVRALEVVVLAEVVELGLQLAPGAGRGLGVQPLLQGLVESLDLAAGLRVVRGGVLLLDPEGGQFGLEPVCGWRGRGGRQRTWWCRPARYR